MARAATKGRKRPQPDARASTRKRSARRQLSAAEQGLFFSRIRLHAKWAFVVLAAIFALGFVGLGVGSGNGVDFSRLWNFGGSSGPSISGSLKKTEKDPADAKAWQDLATAYTNKGRTEDAIRALATYTQLRPRDVKGLSELSSLQITHAQNLQQNASLAQYLQQVVLQSQSPAALGSGPVSKALANDPIERAIQSASATQANEASSLTQQAWGDAVATSKRLATLRPKDVSVQLGLAQAAEQAGDSNTEIAALKKVAKLEPSQAGEIRKKIKSLQAGSSG
jgi:tetratricopeptide (TPR) repeat protein